MSQPRWMVEVAPGSNALGSAHRTLTKRFSFVHTPCRHQFMSMSVDALKLLVPHSFKLVLEAVQQKTITNESVRSSISANVLRGLYADSVSKMSVSMYLYPYMEKRGKLRYHEG